MESEVRGDLAYRVGALVEWSGMATRIRQRFSDVAGVADLELPDRTERPRAAEFGG